MPMSDVVRPGTESADAGSTYTRSSMDTAAVGLSGDVPAAEAAPTEQTMAMALLAAHEQERSRLAEELHDGPAQALANAIFQTEIVDRAVRDDPATARRELQSLRQLLERELDTLRGYINQLRPSLGEAAGLEDALRDSAGAMSQRTGIPVELSLDGDATALPEPARTVALRVAQEALRNVAKHSAANRAWLITRDGVGPNARQWELEVGDDGRGFDPEVVAAHPNRRHFGLRFMRERSELLGSQLTIQSSPAAGTVVRLTIDTAEERVK
jgi:two-component system sensor histidine kinase DegS